MAVEELPILVVDDDPEIRTLIGAALHREGFHCEFADAGDEAIRKLAESRYSLILLDLMMPRVDGQGVIDHVRFSGITTPIVVITAAGPGRIETLSPVRVKAVLTKPFEINELLDVVSALVRRAKA
jgi:DNA-binding response OmpR family regulator